MKQEKEESITSKKGYAFGEEYKCLLSIWADAIIYQNIVKQNCCWEIVVRRMQVVRSINKPLRREKGELLFAYDVAMAFQIQFCLAIITFV